MKLATRKNNTRDGELIVVSKDGTRGVVAGAQTPTMQSLLDDWAAKAPALLKTYEALNAGEGQMRLMWTSTRCIAHFRVCMD